MLLVLALAALCCAEAYRVHSRRTNELQPCISSLYQGVDDSSTFKYNYNPTYCPVYSGGQFVSDALLVRCQQQHVVLWLLPDGNGFDLEFSHHNLIQDGSDPYTVGPSVITFAQALTPFDSTNVENISFASITKANIVIQPESEADSYGTEDPRLVYDAASETYLLLYSAVQNNSGVPVSRLSLAITQTPWAADWERLGPLFPEVSWSKSGALLISSPTSYLFWGDSSIVPGLQLATTINLRNFTYQPEIWLPIRNDSFDSSLVEAGPMPLQLSDGNYLFLYNSARPHPSPKPGYELQYNPGWVVLDGKDPSRIIERCTEPFMSPELPWETGVYGLGLTPNVVFVEGWKELSPDHFLVFYGAADSVVGSVEIWVGH